MSSGSCDDGNTCTKEDQCTNGTCTGELYSCDDGLECTEDACDGNGECLLDVKDGQCLIEGTCYNGNDTAPGSFGCLKCKPAEAQEEWSSALEGLACDDSDFCTLGDQCTEGTCLGEVKDCGDDLECTDDTCIAETGDCQNVRQLDWCIIDDVCYLADSGPEGADVQCSICDPYNSPEAWYHFAEEQACDDGKTCTDAECTTGICTETGVACNDDNSCTDDVCDEQGECSYEPVQNGTGCDEDGHDCTNDVCQEGLCEHKPKAGECFIDELCWTAQEERPGSLGCQFCSPLEAALEWTNVSDETDCDDGLFCTVEDACLAGVCESQTRVCPAMDCTEGFCIEEQDKCVESDLDDGLACDDANPCTLDDECATGQCLGVANDCSEAAAGEPCKVGICDPASEPEPGVCSAQPVEDGEICDDGLFCTDNDQCTGGSCGGGSVVCEVKSCLTGNCSEDTQGCSWEPDPQQAEDFCEDDKVCSFDTTCQANGGCGGGWYRSGEDCEDILGNDNQCMVGACIEPNGCQINGLENGTECSLDNSEAECQQAVCILIECLEGFDDCNDDLEDGCESPVVADPDNCGECNTKCEYPSAVAGCQNSECFLDECEPGFGNCDGFLDTGCDTDIASSINHCGDCDKKCNDGNSFANAYVGCVDSTCQFQGCMVGFTDTDGDCADGGDCVTGCETCKPLLDGLVEIPDDGADNDCQGDGDAINSEDRGFYVDPEFEFGGGCDDPGLGTRACPFKDILYALYETQANQDWSDPWECKREIYVAEGDIKSDTTVADIFAPIIIVGGYLRTADGPWERDWENVVTRLKTKGLDSVVVKGDSQTDWWAVIDGVTLTPKVELKGKLALYLPPGTTGISAEANKESSWLNNVFVWDGDMDDPFQALVETAQEYDVLTIRNNAFIGYTGENATIFMNNVNEPNNILQLNMVPELEQCGRGGNTAIATKEEAGFLSLDPASPDFLKPGPDSPLINKGEDLPYTCGATTFEKEESDLSGQSIPCDGDYDLGCFEWCD
jgi:hypothetical protein